MTQKRPTRGRGRPPLDTGQARQTLSLTISPLVLDEITRRAGLCGLSRSQMVQDILVEHLGMSGTGLQSALPDDLPEAALTPTMAVRIAVELWNATAAAHDLSRCRKTTARRGAAIRARLGEYAGTATWREMLAHIPLSSFLRGENARGWKVTLDFACSPDGFVRILEGKYDDRTLHSPDRPAGARPGLPEWTAAIDEVVDRDTNIPARRQTVPGRAP